MDFRGSAARGEARRAPIATIAVSGLIATAVLLTALPAGAGGDLVHHVKKPGKPYKQVIGANLAPETAKHFTLRVVGPPDVEAFLEEGAEDGPGYQTKYYRGDENITPGVTASDGYSFNFGSDGNQKFRMKVKVVSAMPPGEFCRFVSAHQGEPQEGSTVAVKLNGAECDP
jgi:hypothetical protein